MTASTPLRQLAFSLQEYARRLALTQTAMAISGLDALLIHHRAGLCYLTGMENCYMSAPYAAIVPARGEPILLTSRFEMLNAEATSWCEDRETFNVGDAPLAALARVVKERGLDKGRLGAQLGSLTVSQYAELQALLPGASWQDASALLPDIMLIKSAEEIAHLREAGRLSTLGMAAALGACREGTTDNAVAAAAYHAMVGAGSEYMCIEPIVTVGDRSGIPHSTFRRTTIQSGDAIFIEVGGCYRRYSAPIMRAAAIGPVSDEVRRAADAARDSLNALIDAMQPGAAAPDVARTAKAAWTPLCDELIWHGIYGYSVGLGFPPDWNDAPAVITATADLVLKPGMCFHATTSLRSALKFGVAFSETVLITEDGNAVLTGTPRELHTA